MLVSPIFNRRRNLVDALHAVTDRLALHVEYSKYNDRRENLVDTLTLRFAETILTNANNADSGLTDGDILSVLDDATERLRLHSVLHSYDDATENLADNNALDDANSILN